MSSNPRNALKSMVHNLSGSFKNYDRGARKKAWKALISKSGKNFIEKLLDSPNRPIVGVEKLLSFKEWFYNQAD